MMDKAGKNIGCLLNKMNGSLLWNTLLLCFILVLINKPATHAQVISNNGASVTITSGTFVTSEDLENKQGTIDNDGAISLSGDLSNENTAVTKGLKVKSAEHFSGGRRLLELKKSEPGGLQNIKH